MNDILLIIIAFVSPLIMMALVILYFKKHIDKPKEDQKDDTALNLIKQDLLAIRQEIREGGKSSLDAFQNQLTQNRKASEESVKIVRSVTEQLTKLDETNRQVVGFAEQLQSLENILKNPKQRGILGEYYLEESLKNVFSPNQYQMQYSFKDGAIVDAVIFAGDGKIIPVDSKFSLENYNRILGEKDVVRREELEKIFKQDLKNRIDETAKYVRPEEGTLSFAFMYIPAEAIYYDLLVNKVGAIKSNTRDLIEYALREKNVCIVSPNTFYAYLQTILQGLRAFQIEESAIEIRKGVERLGKHIVAYDQYMQKLGNQIGTTVNTFNTAHKELAKIDKDVVKITDGERKIEPLQIDKPDAISID